MNKYIKLITAGLLSIVLTGCEISTPSNSSSAVEQKYTVTWKNYDGGILQSDEYKYGETPTYNGATPTKPQTEQYSYEFTGWSPEVSKVTGPQEYTAQFEEGPRKYTVTWMNYNGAVLEIDNNVTYGTTPTYDGETPERAGDGRFNYVFKGWSPEVSSVTEDITYVATYTSEIRRFTITWQNYDGTVLEVDNNVAYGATPTYDGERPTKPTSGGFKQTWSGWSPEVGQATEDKTYTATFSNGDPVFCFDLLDYELRPGSKLSDIQGAPWINSNLAGQLNKIKKPSLKDDFYSSVNYDYILSNNNGVFGLADQYVNEALNNIFFGDETINNDILWAFANLASGGDAGNVANYLYSFDLDSFLSTKEAFTSVAPVYTIYKDGNDYVVGFDDGYISGNMNSPSMVWYFNNYFSDNSFIQDYFNVLNILDGTFGFSTSENERRAVGSLEYTIISDAYYAHDGSMTGYATNDIPWPKLKSALLDLGVGGNKTIWVPNHYGAVFNKLFNNYFVNQYGTLNILMKTRIELASRFLVGIDTYKYLNGSLSNLYRKTNGYLFGSEAYISYSSTTDALIRLTKAAFPILYEQSYLALEGSEQVKNTVSQLINDILTGFKEIFAETTWLSQTTRQRAITKIQKMKSESCYPDFYKYFAELKDDDLDTASGLTLLKRYNAAYIETSFSGRSLPSSEWNTMPTYTTNAFYNPTTNSFVILNGLAKGCFYSDSTEVLYGTLGTVIGHEITHGFDSNGSQFDEYGRQANWWTSADRDRFDAKVQKMINFYNNITLYNNSKAIGEKNNTEATADMGGVKVMLHLAKKIPSFDYDLFFKSYAYIWCRSPFDMQTAESIRQDEHPFYHLRTNVTLAQFDEFIQTYNIQPGDGMYIPENQRISIW